MSDSYDPPPKSQRKKKPSGDGLPPKKRGPKVGTKRTERNQAFWFHLCENYVSHFASHMSQSAFLKSQHCSLEDTHSNRCIFGRALKRFKSGELQPSSKRRCTTSHYPEIERRLVEYLSEQQQQQQYALKQKKVSWKQLQLKCLEWVEELSEEDKEKYQNFSCSPGFLSSCMERHNLPFVKSKSALSRQKARVAAAVAAERAATAPKPIDATNSATKTASKKSKSVAAVAHATHINRQQQEALLGFLLQHSSSFKISPQELCDWLHNQDVHSLQDLGEAVGDDLFFHQQLAPTAIKGFKKLAFRQAAVAAADDDDEQPDPGQQAGKHDDDGDDEEEEEEDAEEEEEVHDEEEKEESVVHRRKDDPAVEEGVHHGGGYHPSMREQQQRQQQFYSSLSYAHAHAPDMMHAHEWFVHQQQQQRHDHGGRGRI